MRRSYSFGRRKAGEHPTQSFVFSLLLCAGLAVAAIIEAHGVWRGTSSALAMLAGGAFAGLALAAQRRQLADPAPRTAAIVLGNAYLGSAAGVAFVVGFIEHRPGAMFSGLVAAADGYVMVLFVAMLPVLVLVRRRRLKRE